jgi:starch synthase
VSRPVLHVAPVLAQDVKNQLLALEEFRLLRTAVGFFSYARGGAIDRLLTATDEAVGCNLVKKTASRCIDSAVARRTRSHLWSELVRQCTSRLCRNGFGPKAADTCQAAVDRLGASLVGPGVRLTIGREDCCLASFTATHRERGVCLYDLPTACYETVRRILTLEEAEFPDVSLHNHRAEEYSPGRSRRKQRELKAADHIIVASRFVQGTLRAVGVPAERITVIPYGCEPQHLGLSATNRTGSRKVFLYVGQISLRKGIHRLLRAWKRLAAYRTHRLRLVGSMQLAPKFVQDFAAVFEHVRSLPRADLWQHYAAAYAFVFPAAADGFGLVINEALSCGVPVVASTHSGAPGFITHGCEGLLYPYGDDDKLCAALDQVLSRPEEAAEMRKAAYELALRWTWRHYGEKFIELIMQLLEVSARSTGSPAVRSPKPIAPGATGETCVPASAKGVVAVG